MNKKLRNMMIALLLATSVAVPAGNTVQAMHVGLGVQWSWAGHYFSGAWSQTTNLRRQANRVSASVYKNGWAYSGWQGFQATASKGFTGELGHPEMYYNYE